MALSSAQRHMGKVAAVGCVLCRKILGANNVPAEVHHIGDSEDRSDFLTIPLCPEHHRGAAGFHYLGEREFNRKYKTSELKLLGITLGLIERRRL